MPECILCKNNWRSKSAVRLTRFLWRHGAGKLFVRFFFTPLIFLERRTWPPATLSAFKCKPSDTTIQALVLVALKTPVQPVPRYLVTGACCCHVEHQLWRVPVGGFYFFSLFFNVCFAFLWYFRILFWRQSQDTRLFYFYSLELFFKEAKTCIEVHFGHNSSIISEIGGMGARVKNALITGSPVSLQQWEEFAGSWGSLF